MIYTNIHMDSLLRLWMFMCSRVKDLLSMSQWQNDDGGDDDDDDVTEV